MTAAWEPRRRERQVLRNGEAMVAHELECRGCQGLGSKSAGRLPDGVQRFQRAGEGGAEDRARAKRFGLAEGSILPCPHCHGVGWVAMRVVAVEEVRA